MAVRTPEGHTVLREVALGTNAFPSLVRRVRWHTVPVYDYALITQPLTGEQLVLIGWRNRQGIDDCGNQFHDHPLMSDNRILVGLATTPSTTSAAWSKASSYHRPATFELLARQFFETFPQLEGLRFSHQWGGAIDTCTRFFAFFDGGTPAAAYVLGHTGLGAGATRSGANVMLDLLDGRETEWMALSMVRTKPLLFPPEPFAFAGVQLTGVVAVAADRNGGRRNLWLWLLDRMAGLRPGAIAGLQVVAEALLTSTTERFGRNHHRRIRFASRRWTMPASSCNRDSSWR